MQYRNYLQPKLGELLSHFINKELLTKEIIKECSDYLFTKNSSLPFFKDSELFETIVYLKEVMYDNNLYTLEDVLGFYEKKKDDMRYFISSVEHDSKNILSDSLPLELKMLSSDKDFSLKFGEPEFNSKWENENLFDDETNPTIVLEEY